LSFLHFRSRTPRWVIIVFDLLLAAASLAFAYLIRFDLKANNALIEKEWLILSKSILFYFGVKFLVFYFLKIHKGLVRYTSTEDLKRLFFATLICSILYLSAGLIRYFYLDGYFLFPMSILVMEFLVSFAFAVGSRFIVKLFYLETIKNKNEEEGVLIYGAGVYGMVTKRTIENDSRNNQLIVGFLDDNPKLKGTRIEGITVFHTNDLEKISQSHSVKTLIIAIQQPKLESQKNIIDRCLELKISVQKVPNLKSWVNGEFSSKQFAKINIEDLLGRAPIQLNNQSIQWEIKDKVVLVTGAAGSIGSGLVREIASFNPSLLILIDQAESPLYDLQIQLLKDFPSIHFEFNIGDICNEERMRKIIAQFLPQLVFHAAAYKHVPLMEENPVEAIVNNVFGTKTIAHLSSEFKVEKFVMISTDKAVNPTNIMGASKRISELYVQWLNKQSETKFITTRFGNVLGSNGSVIPLFQRQIESGGPVTVTDERITRFFMTIPEACQLVLEAGTMGNGGEIYVFDMGESVKIIDLAKNMISLNGLELGKDIQLKVTGLRPGEKLYEELLADEENTLPTHHAKILIAKTRDCDEKQQQLIEELIALVPMQNIDSLVQKMKQIVVEYKSNNSIFEKLDE
jgi:FlaA1/EpsC-like NDP-sugar epimerase